jgi:hypothetical protein
MSQSITRPQYRPKPPRIGAIVSVEALRAHVEEVLAVQGFPGFSVAVTDREGIVASETFGLANLDASLFRNIRVREGMELTLRIESFNFTNTPHFNNPNANVSTAANFLAVTSALPDQRQVRLGLRLSF